MRQRPMRHATARPTQQARCSSGPHSGPPPQPACARGRRRTGAPLPLSSEGAVTGVGAVGEGTRAMPIEKDISTARRTRAQVEGREEVGLDARRRWTWRRRPRRTRRRWARRPAAYSVGAAKTTNEVAEAATENSACGARHGCAYQMLSAAGGQTQGRLAWADIARQAKTGESSPATM